MSEDSVLRYADERDKTFGIAGNDDNPRRLAATKNFSPR